MFLYHYVFPCPSDISQNDAEVLKKQRQEMQRRYKEEQWLLVQLEEAAKLCRAEHMAQKARREAEEKAQGKQPGKYCRGAAVKIGGANPCERYVSARQDCLVHSSR